MPATGLTEWLHSRETQTLINYLRHRRGETVRTFLAGNPVELTSQGRAAGMYEIEKLLSGPVDGVQHAFDTITKEKI